MSDNKRDLCGFALRKYIELGFWHNRIVQAILQSTDYSHILKYDLQNENEIKMEIDTLRGLADCYNGMYVDLLTVGELRNFDNYLTDTEMQKCNERLFPESVGNELLEIANRDYRNTNAGYNSLVGELMDIARQAKTRKDLENYVPEIVVFDAPQNIGNDTSVDNEQEVRSLKRSAKKPIAQGRKRKTHVYFSTI